MNNLRSEVTDAPAAEAMQVVDEGLDGFNLSAADLSAVRPLGCYLRETDGTIIGGALARSWGQCCEVQQLWVREDHRGNGLGRELMQLVEREARQRGCLLVFLETFNFQAPEFYARIGYETVAEFVIVPGEVSKQVMQKQLAVES